MADQCYAQLLECSEKQSTIKYSAALAFCKPGIKVSGLEKTRELPFSGPMGEEKKNAFKKIMTYVLSEWTSQQKVFTLNGVCSRKYLRLAKCY